MARLCVDLAQTVADLTAWGRAHAALITTFDEPTTSTIRAAYADRLAVLKETER